MSSTAFGTPVQDAPMDEQKQGNGNGGGENAQVQELDPNDPRLTSEVIGGEESAEGDAYATRPPLPDGKWRAKLKQVDVKGRDGKLVRDLPYLVPFTNPPTPCLLTNIEATVIDNGDGRWDGVQLTDYWVKTFVDRRKTPPASALGTVVVKSGGAPLKGTEREKMNQALKHLAGEPECIIETVWHAGCESCQKAAKDRGERVKDFLIGMHHFPQRKGGEHEATVQCPVCKSMVTARPQIFRYWSLKEAKPTFQ